MVRLNSVASADVLLERDGALASIAKAVDAVRSGAATALFVSGSAGIGKTSVLAAARGLAQDAGFNVASAVGTPMEARLPYGVAGQAVLALGGSAVEDVAELARLGGQPARLYRMYRFFSAAAADAPLLLTLDDLHWADADSLEFLGFLCRRLAGVRILVVGALRPEPDPASRLAEELVGSGHAGLVRLEPLSLDAATAVLGNEASLDVGGRQRVLESCAGSPLLLKVAASALSGGASLSTLSADRHFSNSLLLERFVGLGNEAFGYVRAASVFGVRFKPPLAGALARLPESEWLAAHADLVHAGLLDDLGGGWTAFVHPMFAQALFESLQSSERERSHARAFALLIERGEPDAVAAEHAVAAGLANDPLAIEVAARAGRQALGQGALAAACTHLANAVELADHDADPELLLDYATALVSRGRPDDMRAVCHQLLADRRTRPRLRARALALLALTTMYGADPAEAERLYEAAVQAAVDDPATQLAVLAEAAVTCQVVAPVDWTIQITSRALALLPAESTGRPDLEFLLGFTKLMGGDGSGVESVVGEMRSQLARSTPPHPGGWSMPPHAINACKLIEDPGRSTELFEREFAAAVEAGAPMQIIALAAAYADNAHRLGHLREALDWCCGLSP